MPRSPDASDFEPALASIRELLACAEGPSPVLIKEATLGPVLRERAPELEAAFRAELVRGLLDAPAKLAVEILECWDFGQPRTWTFSADLDDPYPYARPDEHEPRRWEAWAIVREARGADAEQLQALRDRVAALPLPAEQLAWCVALVDDAAGLPRVIH